MDNTKLRNRMSGKVQELQQPVEAVTAPDTSLASVDSNYIALGNNAMAIITENLKYQPLSYDLFDVVKSPSGGATVFEVPGLAGAEAEKELVGIILDYTTSLTMSMAFIWKSPMRRLTGEDLAGGIVGRTIQGYHVEAAKIKLKPYIDSNNYRFILGK